MCDSSQHRCPDCDGENGNHYPGCIYEGTEGQGGRGYHRGGDNGKPPILAGIVITIAGFLILAFIITIFGIDPENIPAPVLIIAFLVVLFVLCYLIYGRKSSDE